MLDDSTKAALAKAAQAISSGKMKPGDSMIVAGDKEPKAEAGDDGIDQIGQELFDAKDSASFSQLLREYVERCIASAKQGKY